MAYEKTDFDSLFGILDVLVYEVGRLAIIEKYGYTLADAEKAKIDELVSKQKENVDQLCEIYKNQLNPIMNSLHSIGDTLDDIAKKIIVFKDVYDKKNFQQQGTDSIVVAETTTDVSVAPQEVAVDEKTTETPSVSEVAAIPEAVSTQQDVVTGSEIVHDLSDSTNMIPAAVETNVNDVVPTVEESSTTVPSSPIQTESVDVKVENQPNEIVLSPIEDDTLVSVNEQKAEIAPEVGIAAAEQQLQTIENAKQEIIANTSLTPDQKVEALEKYTRMTQGTVKAILVTKAQYEKLAASRVTQKTLLDATKEVSSQPISASTEEQTVINTSLLEKSAEDKQKELQVMLEQANALYKEGKTKESQELFDKVGALNKELQSGNVPSTKTEGGILVKK